ncbi:unnamed protein product [Didymodactylos carnosus]|uniref:Methyltransferase domain-containing protein n=1 Tax=Didymodactylos carnosus TaxID=1234261 RepID=A0A815UPM2_9BILA|nr:unnamed protein product [Didymodactylos carnosus]CAF1620627.1 unnamed protein product [Didymodactylos carnosus]CAF4376579.1 unnamed protein product [Didymodactylos carnosus]CAF4439927.1 unnamed protein product [Didymodactylos carnosus]
MTSNRSRYYMGRRIATVISHEEAGWLCRRERSVEEQPNLLLDYLELVPGMVVADIGAGLGYLSVRIASRITPSGIVYATDVQPQMVHTIVYNAKRLGLPNIKPVLSTPNNLNLPVNLFDLILMVDVYHECSNPPAILHGIRKALKPNGKLVLVEYRAEDPLVPIAIDHKMTVGQVRLELESNGFRFIRTLEFLPWQHVIVFKKRTNLSMRKLLRCVTDLIPSSY